MIFSSSINYTGQRPHRGQVVAFQPAYLVYIQLAVCGVEYKCLGAGRGCKLSEYLGYMTLWSSWKCETAVNDVFSKNYTSICHDIIGVVFPNRFDIE